MKQVIIGQYPTKLAHEIILYTPHCVFSEYDLSLSIYNDIDKTGIEHPRSKEGHKWLICFEDDLKPIKLYIERISKYY